MIAWNEGIVTAEGSLWHGAKECEVLLFPERVERVRALAYPYLVGVPNVGDRVLLSSAAAHRGLGTGGYHFIVALPDRLPGSEETHLNGVYGDGEGTGRGHIIKARYTPLQYMTMSVDEQDSPWHSLLAEADSIEGMPVVVADLHSALPAVVAAVRESHPEAKIAYIMDDGGALPAWFSRNCASLTQAGHILGTITSGQSFGGDLETVNIHTALLAAHVVWKADLAIIAQGPGNLGTGTRWGFSGVSVGEAINAVHTLGGRAVAVARMSGADLRVRHRGISHHTLTALIRVALSPLICPLPFPEEEVTLGARVDPKIWELIASQSAELKAAEHVNVIEMSSCGLGDTLASSPVRLSTMGRTLEEDPLAFLSAGLAGRYAASLLD